MSETTYSERTDSFAGKLGVFEAAWLPASPHLPFLTIRVILEP